ncbi:MAG: Maf family protein, partial [Prevotella sp.]|nr:Maf family protein [Prevotella sp.]
MNYRIFLASNSPRRKELLSGLGIPFEVRVNGDIDESYPLDLPPEAIPLHISRKKAAAY